MRGSRRPVVGPVLTARHRRARLAFAIDHQNWQLRHWHPVLFTDESRFNLSTFSRCERVWRCRGERYAACNIIQHDRFGGIGMKSLDPLSEPTLVQWDLGSSWSTTLLDLMWLEADVNVPMGPGIKTGVGKHKTYSLLYNEFVVYNPAQIRMRYLLRINFNYSSLW
ncbi:Poly [ADP-ribose] polymerase 2 [Takifugu flavidus]|uniref:NAD(+) ADP-ribosyltransferase n=1 Tax=Takifugu flavidus TaxID=433684 RepID=A0A5C6P5T3_9TELE|nr:Poly [ADP-ribose] polymerase 2 [Takifugu flavidus]